MSKLQVIALFLISFLGACAQSGDEIVEQVDVEAKEFHQFSPEIALSKLKTLLIDHPERLEVVKDELLIIQTMVESKALPSSSAKNLLLWESLLPRVSHHWKPFVLDKWFVSAFNVYGIGVFDPSFVGKLALRIRGSDSEFFRRQGFEHSEKFKKAMSGPLKSKIESDGNSHSWNVLAEDHEFCSKFGEGRHELPSSYNKERIRARRLLCAGSFDKAYAVSTVSLQSEMQEPLSSNDTINFGREFVDIARSTGDREIVSDAYNRYYDFLERKKSTSSAQEIELEKIKIGLWAARYDALLGRRVSALKRVDLSLKQIGDFYKSGDALPASFESQLMIYRAEAALIQAFRILLEERKLDEAHFVLHDTMNLVGMPSGWRLRLMWFAGLMSYLKGNLDQAFEHWMQLLSEDRELSHRDKVLFWLARIHLEKGSKGKAREMFERLQREYPLSFYTVVAPKEAHFPFKAFQYQRAHVRLKGSSVNLLDSVDHLSRLRLKTELLLASGAVELAGVSAEELSKEFGTYAKKVSGEPLREDLIYLSKLLILGGHTKLGIRTGFKAYYRSDLEEKLTPELLGVLFPIPFREVYEEAAATSGVPKELLLAISRQESLFDVKAFSGAKAAGLMQLILPTARQYGGSDVSYAQLFNPAYNIKVGARYLNFLRTYFGGREQWAYAAYNAGEFAVELWLNKRDHGDVLTALELIPFSESRKYAQNVWRNRLVYQGGVGDRQAITWSN